MRGPIVHLVHIFSDFTDFILTEVNVTLAVIKILGELVTRFVSVYSR